MAKSKQAVRRAQLEILKRHYLSEFEYYQIELALSKKKQDKFCGRTSKTIIMIMQLVCLNSILSSAEFDTGWFSFSPGGLNQILTFQN